ncbi:MAG: hypothetical protein ABFE01_22625, partial [Phycisphaerales bacterium]
MGRFSRIALVAVAFGMTIASRTTGEQSVARQWNEALLDAIRVDVARPTIHARNFFHVSLAM